MAVITKSIGSAGGRDYSTVAAWEASLPANLVTDGNSYVGECYNDSEYLMTTGTYIFSPTAHTTDATHTITLTVASGQSFQDNAGVRSNALHYDQSLGVGFRSTYNYAGPISIANTNDYLTIQRMMAKASTTGSPCITQDTAQNHFIAKDIVVEHTAGGGTSPVVSFDGGADTVKLINLVVIKRDSLAGVGIQGRGLILGCTVMRPSDKTAGGTGILGVNYRHFTLYSNAVFGFTTAAALGSSGAVDDSKNNATDQSSWGVTSASDQLSVTYTSATPFTGAADASLDLRAVAATALAANGFKDGTNGPNDISATARSATPTIGAWELTGGAAATRGTPFDSRGTAFNGGRAMQGVLRAPELAHYRRAA